MALEESLQGQRGVVVLVPRGVDQGDCALLPLMFQQLDGILLLTQFLPVTLLELLPAGRVPYSSGAWEAKISASASHQHRSLAASPSGLPACSHRP